MGRNFAFIDSQNLHLGTKRRGWEIDYSRFRKYLSDKYGVETAFMFFGFIPEMEKLYSRLRRQGFEIVFKPIVPSGERDLPVVKGNVDVELVLHALVRINEYDQAVIVSGDGDFHCLVEYLHAQRKLRKIMVPNERYSSLLRRFKGSILDLGSVRNKISK